MSKKISGSITAEKKKLAESQMVEQSRIIKRTCIFTNIFISYNFR
jgi:hypothetical protein